MKQKMKSLTKHGSLNELLENENTFKALVKIYTGGAYKGLGNCMRTRKYGLLSHYATDFVTSLNLQKNKNIFYSMFQRPVYRGGKVDLSSISVGDIKTWPTFTSTTS